jgi:hypothetical protein
MEIPMLRNRPALLEPGNYHVRVGDCYIMDGIFGREVVLRFDLLEKGLTDLSLDEWTEAALIGGRQPSRLYSWISAMVFDGKPLPAGYRLRTASLLLREALAGIALVDYDRLLYNRILCLYPLRAAKETEAGPAIDLQDPGGRDGVPAPSHHPAAVTADHPGAAKEDSQ